VRKAPPLTNRIKKLKNINKRLVGLVVVTATASMAHAENMLEATVPHEIGRFVDKLANAQIISAALMAGILGLSAIACCPILKQKNS